MVRRITRIFMITIVVTMFASSTYAGQYLVVATGGPGFTSPQETLEVLEKGINPTFDALLKLQADNKIIAGGLPVGARSFVFIVEASSNAEVDLMLRDIPAWGVLDWNVTPLQSLQGRAEKERKVVKELKKQLN